MFDLSGIEIMLILALLGIMMFSIEIGFLFGSRVPSEDVEDREFLLAPVGGASLGLVAILLGFSYSASGARFFDRANLMVDEVNAISTAYLRADLLKEPYAEKYRQSLRDYIETRITLFDSKNTVMFDELLAKSEALHPVIWKAMMAGLRLSPEFHESVLPPLNAVFDIDTTRVNRVMRHMSPWVLGALILCSGVALSTLGYGCGLHHRRYFFFTSSVAFMLAVVLWILIDLDYPRYGLIHLNQTPMLELRERLKSKN